MHAGPGQRPAPIASLAKVMTAYVVLLRRPLHGRRRRPGHPCDGARRARLPDAGARRAQSVVAVRAGERLTERDALLAMLLPSANNVAVLLARFGAGTVPRLRRAR